MIQPFRIGTGNNRLALVQTSYIAKLLQSTSPEIPIEVVQIRTTDDKIRNLTLEKIGSTILFTKGIEIALLENKIDAAVYSLKDLESTLPAGLILGAVPVREDVRDALIAPKRSTLENLPIGARILTGSLRRKAQLLHLRGDFVIETVHGNVETRIRRFYQSGADGLIAAAAELQRLTLDFHIAEYIPVDVIIPAVGQGALGIEIRANDERARIICDKINNNIFYQTALGERSFLRTLKGDRKIPIGCIGKTDGDTIKLTGFIATADGSQFIKQSLQGQLAESESVGKLLAENILNAGGNEILEQFHRRN
jgi:hydroxymethylbilane synthase